MDDQLQAFFDESNKPARDPKTGQVSGTGNHYAVGAAVILKGDQERTRRALEEIRADLGYELHYSDLSQARRRDLIDAILGIATWDGYLFETAKPLDLSGKREHRTRSRVVGQALKTLSIDVGVCNIVLESRSKPAAGFVKLDDNDHKTFQKLRGRQEVSPDLRVRHGTKDEPLLWIADLLAGVRTDWLCNTNSRALFPLVAHRIQSIVQVPSH